MAGGTERTALEDPQEPQLVSHLQARCPINFLIFFLKSPVRTSRRVGVHCVLDPVIPGPFLSSIFNSVCSLAQTYDLCSVWQSHPSPRQLACGSGRHWGPNSVPVIPHALSWDWPELNSTG